MHCEEFENRLNDLIDQRLPLANDVELQAHAGGCAPCAQLLRDYDSLLEGVGALAVIEPPAGFSLRVVAAHEAESRPRSLRFRPVARRPMIRRALAGLAIAATLLVAAIPIWSWLRSSSQPAIENAPAVVLVETASDASVDHVAAQGDVSRPALVDQARETYEPLLAATSESLSSVLDALPSADRVAVDDQAPTLATRTIAWDGELAAGIRPVATSATRSVAALLRVLPGSSRMVDERGVPQ